MNYRKEEDLFNQGFRNPIIYIFSPSKNHKQFVLTEFMSQNPLRVKSIDANENLHIIIDKGKKYSQSNGYSFIDNEIYVPII